MPFCIAKGHSVSYLAPCSQPHTHRIHAPTSNPPDSATFILASVICSSSADASAAFLNARSRAGMSLARRRRFKSRQGKEWAVERQRVMSNAGGLKASVQRQS